MRFWIDFGTTVDPPDPWFLCSRLGAVRIFTKTPDLKIDQNEAHKPRKWRPFGSENPFKNPSKNHSKFQWVFYRFRPTFWHHFGCQNIFKIISKMASILASILKRILLRKWSQNASKLEGKTPMVAPWGASESGLEINLVFLVFWDASGNLLGSPRSPFGGLLAHLAASFAILGPFWLSLWSTTSQEAENLPRTAENQPRTAENQPRTAENQPRSCGTNTGQKYFSHSEC